MWTEADLVDLTDPVSVARGRAYARSGRVVALGRQPGRVDAEVQGSERYRVSLGDDSWSCDCPVGATGAFCKHAVAVVVALGTSDDEAGTETGDDPVSAWLDTLGPADLRALLGNAADLCGDVRAMLAAEYVAATGDLAQLSEQVDDVLRPRRQFYDYREANQYAGEAAGVADLLVEAAPSPELLRLVERAITLAVRAIRRSDDSSGAQGDLIRTLLDRHRDVAAAVAVGLPAAQRRRLAEWLHKFRFDGKQDFFEIEVDAYAAALGPAGVERYRSLVEASAANGGEEFAVRYARGRLAILDRDVETIVRIIGDGLANQYRVRQVVEALDTAGLGELAVLHAERGLDLPRTPHAGALVDRLVRDAVGKGDRVSATALRRRDFEAAPDGGTLKSFREAATASGEWAELRAGAEQRLLERNPRAWLLELLGAGRDDEAWDFAQAQPGAASSADAWETLCDRRAATAPADTLPVYRNLVAGLLAHADRRNYALAARLLKKLSAASRAAGVPDEFAAYMAEVAEANRRRPTCLAEFRRAGLLR